MHTNELLKVEYLSELDRSMQPALVCPASGEEDRPLAVCLHTWSCGINGYYEGYLEQCRMRNWHFIFPLFRGPNWKPDACGSDLVVSDLECAVSYMQENYRVDASRIYLVGGSGGGFASLLMAGRKPELFTAISAWCPISDLIAWYTQTNQKKADPSVRSYDTHIFEACGGDPITCPAAAQQAKYRSPLTWLPEGKGKTILDIGTGIHDGHTGSVPISHAMHAFNILAAPEDRIDESDIAFMVAHEKVPEHLQFQGEDPAYGPYRVLLRKTSGKVRFTLFEGGHDILIGPACGFLSNQVRNQEPMWYSGDSYDGKASELTK